MSDTLDMSSESVAMDLSSESEDEIEEEVGDIEPYTDAVQKSTKLQE